MDIAELETLLSAQSLHLLEKVGPLSPSVDTAHLVSRLRAEGHPAQRVAAVVTQAQLRYRAREKFDSFANQMLFTPAGLEQASRLTLGIQHAKRFLDASLTHITDLGCGIGGDALAYAGAGLTVEAVDADPVTAIVAGYNLAPFKETVQVRHARAQDIPLVADTALWCDPARRLPGHTSTQRQRPEHYSPPLEWIFSLAADKPTGIKLGPGLKHSLIPKNTEAQWISVDGATLELIVWSQQLARDGVTRTATVIRHGRHWEITGAHDAPDEPVRPLGAYLHEPEGSVIRARLIGDTARSLDAGMVAEKIAYLTSDRAHTSPFVRSFAVREELPNDTKKLAAALRHRNIGTVEIKKRGVDLDPATLRKKLKLSGDESATLIITRDRNTRRTLLVDRLPSSEN